jgi:hypothetical protein
LPGNPRDRFYWAAASGRAAFLVRSAVAAIVGTKLDPARTGDVVVTAAGARHHGLALGPGRGAIEPCDRLRLLRALRSALPAGAASLRGERCGPRGRGDARFFLALLAIGSRDARLLALLGALGGDLRLLRGLDVRVGLGLRGGRCAFLGKASLFLGGLFCLVGGTGAGLFGVQF